jgi:hypothetical protein
MDIRVCHVILTLSLLDIRRRTVRSPAASIGWYLEAHAGEIVDSSVWKTTA